MDEREHDKSDTREESDVPPITPRLEERIEQKVKEALDQAESNGSAATRRTILGFLAGGLVGSGLGLEASAAGSNSRRKISGQDVTDLQVANIVAQRVVTDELLTNDFNGVRVADPSSPESINEHLEALSGAKSQSPGGGVVFLPRGIYEPSEPVVLRRGTHIVGSQWGTSGDSGYGVGPGGNRWSVITDKNMSDDRETIIDTIPRPNDNSSEVSGIHRTLVLGIKHSVRGPATGIRARGIANFMMKELRTKDIGGHGVHIKGVQDYEGWNLNVSGGDDPSQKYAGFYVESAPDVGNDSQGVISGTIGSKNRAYWLNGSGTQTIKGGAGRSNVACANGDFTSRSNPGYCIYHSGKGSLDVKNTNIGGGTDSDDYVEGVVAENPIDLWGCNIKHLDGARIKIDGAGRFMVIRNCNLLGTLSKAEYGIEVTGNGVLPKITGLKIRNTKIGIRTQKNRGFISDLFISGTDTALKNTTSDRAHITGFYTDNVTNYFADSAANWKIEPGSGSYTNAVENSQTFSGDGKTVRFTVDNFQMDEQTRWARVSSDVSTDAGRVVGVDSTSFNDGSFDFEFESAPPSGTNNVTVFYTAKGPSAA